MWAKIRSGPRWKRLPSRSFVLLPNPQGRIAMDKYFDSIKPYSDLLGRILIAGLFVMAGWGKITGYAGTQQYMAAMGVPGGLLPLVIALELGGDIAIVLGLFTRPIALLLAGFSIAAAFLFHGAPDQVNQRSEEHTSALQSLMRISYAVFCLRKKPKRQR